MENKITAEDLIGIIEKSDLDPTIKEILIRDIKNEGVNEFLVEQVLAYCDEAIAILKSKMPQTTDPAA